MANREKEKRRKRVVSAKKMAETSGNRISKAYSLPEGVGGFFLKKAGLYKLDIIPFAAGKGNPAADEGEMAVGRTYHVHARVGPNNDTYCCPAMNFSEPCPICEYRAKLARDPNADEELVKALRPRQRQLWNVVDENNADRGVQVWDFSSFNFGDHLFAKIDRYPEHETFADPEEGKTLHVCAVEKDGGGFKFFDCADIEFRKREPISDEILKSAVCLDDILLNPSYETLKRAYFQEPSDDDDEPAPSAKRKPSDDDDKDETETNDNDDKDQDDDPTAEDAGIEVGSTVEHEEHGVCEAAKISGDGTSLTLKDEDGDLHKAVAPSEVTLVEEEDDKPVAKGKEKTAVDCGFDLEDIVYHAEFGKCEIVKIAKDGLTVVLEDLAEGDLHTGVKPTEISKKKAAPSERNGAADDDALPAPKAKAAAPKGRAAKDVPFEDDEDDEDDQPPPPKKNKGGKK